MTVGELKAELSQYDDELSVVAHVFRHEKKGEPRLRQSILCPVFMASLISHGVDANGFPLLSLYLEGDCEVEQGTVPK